jgi:DNA polymerase-1
LICSGDRDSFQLISPHVTVLYPKKGVTELARMTPDAVREKYGLSPEQYPDFAALRGDPSDNLPSIPGVGEKTAAKWINEFGSLSHLIARIDEVPGKAGQSLRDSITTVLTNRELTQLRHDLPLTVELDDIKWSGIDLAHATQLFDKLEIKALRDRAKALAGESAIAPEVKKSTVKVMRVSDSKLRAFLSSATSGISVLKSPDGILLGDNGAVAIAVADQSGNVLLGEFRFDSPPLTLGGGALWITHNAKELIRYGVIESAGFDCELAAYLINPGTRDLDLEDLLRKFLGISVESAPSDLFASGWNPEIVTELHQLQKVLALQLKERELLSLFHDLELPTLEILAEMERVGIAVDISALKKLHRQFTDLEESAMRGAYQAVGHEFNVASPKQLQSVLFDELKLPKTKKIKTGYSTDAESLEWLHATTAHPLLQNLLSIRENSKLRTTVEGLQSAVGSDGRIHTTFQQTVTATGRLSSTEPNLQNIPIRTDDGRKIRGCFIAAKPFTHLMTADYSQIEMRIMAHLSGDEGLLKAFHAGEDLHSTVASQVFAVKREEVTSEMRRQIKAMSYGLAYGLSSFGLAQQLDITPADASALMGRYFERFGGIQDYLKEVVVIARTKGYTETILGRRRYLPDLNHENRQRREIAERMALNAPIQGSAADIIKVAMRNLHLAMKREAMSSRLLLQVHDELIFEVASGEESALEALVRAEMGQAYPLKAPLDVNVGFGRTWDDAAH